jgi:SAM-dependent methyltransferase
MISDQVVSGSVEMCPVCKAQDQSVLLDNAGDYITGEEFQIRRCASCGLAFTFPRPASLQRYYPSYYRQYTWSAQSLLKTVYSLRARAWARSRSTPGRALEIGCGDGWILDALRQRGWTVVGNERTVPSTTFASKVNELPVFVGDLGTLKSAQFDLIIMVHVLEHMVDPVGTLRHCVRLLREGGTLVVVVPNIESWQARWFGSLWFELDVPRHLFHFSPRALSYAFSEAGLSVTTPTFPWLDHALYGWMQSLLNYCGFPRNLLTKVLMGADHRTVRTPSGLAQAFAGALLLIPSFLFEVGSRLARGGAVMELCGIKSKYCGSVQAGMDDRPSTTKLDQSFYDEIWVAWNLLTKVLKLIKLLRLST